eukprot:6469072-Amphidinium_carterae.1
MRYHSKPHVSPIRFGPKDAGGSLLVKHVQRTSDNPITIPSHERGKQRKKWQPSAFDPTNKIHTFVGSMQSTPCC